MTIPHSICKLSGHFRDPINHYICGCGKRFQRKKLAQAHIRKENLLHIASKDATYSVNKSGGFEIDWNREG